MSIFDNHDDEDEPESTTARPSRSRSLRLLFAVLAFTLALAAMFYILQRRGIDVGDALVTAKTSSEDAATTAAVKTALALSSKVSAFAIDVDTTSGVVHLKGVVPSEPIRDLAVGIAADTAGVRSVQDSLTIEPTARPSPEMEQWRARIADLEIRVELDARLRGSPVPVGDTVVWSVDDREVTLTGVAESFRVRSAAERIARDVDNVVKVINEIEVSEGGEEAASEVDTRAALSEQIRFELYSSGAFRLDDIEVRADDGVVTLDGQVRSSAEKLLAERIVRDVDGVDEVVNDLEVLTVFSRASSSSSPVESRRVMWRIAALAGAMR